MQFATEATDGGGGGGRGACADAPALINDLAHWGFRVLLFATFGEFALEGRPEIM